ncbi:MAG: protein kinase domain-containing protein [Pirellulaceae bacterium]
MVDPEPTRKIVRDDETRAEPRLDESQAIPGSPLDPDATVVLGDANLETPDPSRKDSPQEGSRPLVRYFGSYELLNEIARGGMGVVFRARQSGLNRIVAVKMIIGGQLASPEQVQRFLIEAEAAANLNHPGIVPVYEFGQHENTHYFSMGFVEGPSLADYAADNPLEPQQAVALVHKIAQAVAYAHEHGVVHRDLKPANILLEQGVEPRITDFGLAKKTDEDDGLTKAGSIMGSVFFMSPEQALGKIDQIGPPTDIYSLGAILYKLLTGRPPFQAAGVMETIRQVTDHQPVPPRRLNPRIPRDLETICLKCLDKDQTRRYLTADALADDLQRFQEGRPIEARPISRAAHLWRWCRRNPLPASLSAGLAIALLAGVFIAATLWNRAQSEHRRAQDQQHMVQVVSNMVLKKSLDETEAWMRGFFYPVEQQMRVAQAWGDQGLLTSDDPDDLNQLMVPLIENFPQISSMMVADDRGREHMLLCVEKRRPDTQLASRQWRCRLTQRDEHGDEVTWIEWSDQQPQPIQSTEDLPDYDPRKRPWFQGAVESSSESDAETAAPAAIHWTAPYVFFTTKDLGITASIRFSGNKDREQVVASDVLLADITRFTSNKRPTPNGSVLVLTEQQEMIGLPATPQFKEASDWKLAFLKQPAELDLDVAAEAASMVSFSDYGALQIKQFRSSGQAWWVGARPFLLGNDQVLWILVTIPESDLRDDLTAINQD